MFNKLSDEMLFFSLIAQAVVFTFYILNATPSMKPVWHKRSNTHVGCKVIGGGRGVVLGLGLFHEVS